MTDAAKQLSWPTSLARVAAARTIPLPLLIPQGMGTARTEVTPDGHFVTLRRRLIHANESAPDTAEWTLWETDGDEPRPVATFRTPQRPQPDSVEAVLAVLERWLVRSAPPDALRVDLDTLFHDTLSR